MTKHKIKFPDELRTAYRSIRSTATNSTSIILPYFMIEQLGWLAQDNIRITWQEDDTLKLERVGLGPKHNTTTNEN